MSASLVTGGAGFIALYVVKTLLEQRQCVHTTVRSLRDAAKCQPLLDLQVHYPDQLKLFEADLLKEGSFSKAMEGCAIVYHVASPFLVPQQIKDGLKECIVPALQGTRNVLESVNKCQNVQRDLTNIHIVAAMYGDAIEITSREDKTVSETCWNETSSVTHDPYGYSKLVAEREAWKISDLQTRWDLVVINPGLVLGPSLSPGSASGSLFMLENMYQGNDKMGCPELFFSLVDVRDVAWAHVKAGTTPAAKGRYLIAGDRTISLLGMADLVRPIHRNPKVLPRRNLPKLLVYAAGPFIGVSFKWVSRNLGIQFQIDNSKSVRELGISYRPADKVLKDHYEAWLRNKDLK